MNTTENAATSTKLLDIQHDQRVNCWSVLASMEVGEYLSIAQEAYSQRGGIKHQRDALKTTSARRIRSRLVEDLKSGAIIPPIVIGLVITEFDASEQIKSGQDIVTLLSANQRSLSIIDGMQRTTALLEATDSAPIGEKVLRVEIWIAESADSLIYRMLVLNTGQIPWNLKQQLNVVFEPLIQAIESKISFSRILKRKDGRVERRWNGGEFAAEDLVEAYIAFGLRRTEVDTQEHLADEFSRLDMADALTTRKYDHYFYPVVQIMVDLDIAISNFNPEKQGESQDENYMDGLSSRSLKKTYTRGRNIFDTQPARVGFIVAAAASILGRIGMDKAEVDSNANLANFQISCSRMIDRTSNFSGHEMEEFLALGVLSEVLSRRPSSAVGRWERNFFENAFKILFEVNFEVPTLETCWRA
jgi:hypothetical protein